MHCVSSLSSQRGGRHLYQDLKVETHWAMVLKVYPALSWVVQQLTMFFALRTVIPNPNQEEKIIQLIVLGSITLGIVGVWHYTVDAFENIRLGGKSRMILRRALVSTMIQLTNSASEKYPSGECLSIMSEAVENATSECWVGFIGLWATSCQLLAVTALSIWSLLRVPYMIPLPFVMIFIDSIILWMRKDEQAE